MNKNEKISSIIIIAVVTVLFAGFMVFNHSRIASVKNKLISLDNQIATIKDKISASSVDVGTKMANKKAELLGVDAARVSSDTNLAKKFFETTLRWNNSESYEKARQNGMKFCTDDAKNTYFKVFMPKISTVVREIPVDIGKYKKVKTNRIDSGKMRSSFGGVDTKLVNYKDGVYEYLSIATMRTQKLNNSVDGRIAVSYTVGDDAKLTNVQVYPISGYFD